MFLHECMPFLHVEVILHLHPRASTPAPLPRRKDIIFIFFATEKINKYNLVITQWELFDGFSYQQVVELDPVILSLAKNFFGFTEDNCLKVVYQILVAFFLYFHNLQFKIFPIDDPCVQNCYYLHKRRLFTILSLILERHDLDDDNLVKEFRIQSLILSHDSQIYAVETPFSSLLFS